MDFDVHFLLALLPILSVAFVIWISVIVYKRKNAKLLNHFNARINFLEHVEILLDAKRFYLTRIGQHRRGSYPALIFYVKENCKLVLANSKASKFLFVFGFPKNKQNIKLGDQELALITEDKNIQSRLEQTISSSPESLDLVRLLFQKEFSYIKISTSWIFDNWWSIRRTNRVIFVGLDEVIYERPEKLESYIRGLIQLFDTLGVHILSCQQSE